MSIYCRRHAQKFRPDIHNCEPLLKYCGIILNKFGQSCASTSNHKVHSVQAHALTFKVKGVRTDRQRIRQTLDLRLEDMREETSIGIAPKTNPLEKDVAGCLNTCSSSKVTLGPATLQHERPCLLHCLSPRAGSRGQTHWNCDPLRRFSPLWQEHSVSQTWSTTQRKKRKNRQKREATQLQAVLVERPGMQNKPFFLATSMPIASHHTSTVPRPTSDEPANGNPPLEKDFAKTTKKPMDEERPIGCKP